MKNQIDLIGAFQTQWIKYSDYELNENDKGECYLIPAEDATFTLYNPFEVASDLVFDLLNLGEEVLKAEDHEEKTSDNVLVFVKKYGLLGLVGASVYNRDIVGEEQVLLIKNNLIQKQGVMESWEYIKQFLPFVEEDDVTIRKYKEELTIIKAEDSPKFYGKRPLILDIVFSKFYAEKLEWFLTFAKDIAIHFNQLLMYKGANLTEPVTILADRFKAEKIGMTISMHHKPILTWEVDALKTVIELLYGFAVTDDQTQLSRCTYCGKVYVAKSEREKYCSPSCRNCANVIKSRNKKKIEASEAAEMKKGVSEMDRRKELVQAYQERAITGGVYRIVNQVTGDYYLDQAVDLKGSKNRFDFSVTNDGCAVFKLQKVWKQYGGENFAFEVLEEIEMKPEQSKKEFTEELKVLKQLWQEKLDPAKAY